MNKREILLVGLLFLIAIFFSTYQLTESPSVWYDEGEFFQTAANFASHGIAGLQLAPGYVEHIYVMTVGYPFVYSLALVFKIFGTSILVGRSLMVFFILAFIAGAFFLIRRQYGDKIAIAGLALTATFPPLYGNGKSVIGEVPASLLTILTFISLYFAFENKPKRSKWFVLTGIFLGLTAATKPTYLILIVAVAIALGLKYLTKKVTLRQVGIVVPGAVVPILLWFLTQFDANTPALQMLHFYTNPYEITDLRGSILRNFISLFTNPAPLYLVLMIAVWSFSLLRRRILKEEIPVHEIAAYTASLLFIMSFLRLAGWFRYLFPAQVLTVLYFPFALKVIFHYILPKIKISSVRLKSFAFAGVIFILSAYGVYGLLFDSWVAEFYGSEKTKFWESYLAAVPSEKSLFFYDTPEVTILSKSRNYYQYLEPAGGPFGKKELAVIEEGRVDKIIVETRNFEAKKDWFSKNYHLEREAYKYSILEKN